MMADYKLRAANEQDIDSIIDLCEQHARFENCNYDRTGKADKLCYHLFRANATIKCIVVETTRGIEGYATFMHEFSTWEAAYYMHMDCLYLKPELRGKGIGRKIVELIYTAASSAGCVNVQWQTPEDNYEAIGFYRKMNAAPKQKVRFYLDCEN